MSFFKPASPEARLHNMDNRWLMPALFIGALLIYLVGGLLSPYQYTDPHFVIYYFGTELQVVAYLLLITLLFLPADRIGLRRPQLASVRYLLPFVLWLLVVLGAWLTVRMSVPTAVTAHAVDPWLILRTTLVVGVTEEWVFRGIVFAVLARWLGLRRGAYAALAAFGCFHLMNIVIGMPVAGALAQTVLAFMSGSILLLAAIATRSLWIPMIGHGLYDFFVFDIARMVQASGGSSVASLVVMANGIVLAIICLVLISRLPGEEPYPS